MCGRELLNEEWFGARSRVGELEWQRGRLDYGVVLTG